MPLSDKIRNAKTDLGIFLTSEQGYTNERLLERDNALTELAQSGAYSNVVGAYSTDQLPALDKSAKNFICITLLKGQETEAAYDAYCTFIENKLFGDKTHWALFCESKISQNRLEKDPDLEEIREKLHKIDIK